MTLQILPNAILCGRTKLNPGSGRRLIGPTRWCFVLTINYSFGVVESGKVVREFFKKSFLGALTQWFNASEMPVFPVCSEFFEGAGPKDDCSRKTDFSASAVMRL